MYLLDGEGEGSGDCVDCALPRFGPGGTALEALVGHHRHASGGAELPDGQAGRCTQRGQGRVSRVDVEEVKGIHVHSARQQRYRPWTRLLGAAFPQADPGDTGDRGAPDGSR